MWWIIGVYLAVWMATAVVASEMVGADDPADYLMATLCGVFWPLFAPVWALHKLYEIIRWR